MQSNLVATMIDSTSRNTHYFLGDGAFLMRRIDHDGYNGFDCFPFREGRYRYCVHVRMTGVERAKNDVYEL